MFEIYMPILDNLFCLWLLVVIAIPLMEILHIAYLFVNDEMDYMKPCAYKRSEAARLMVCLLKNDPASYSVQQG